MMFEKLIVVSDDKLITVIKKIKENKLKMVFVEGDANILLGCISESDIQQALFSDGYLSVHDSVAGVFNRDVKFRYTYQPIDNELLSKYQVMPVVDDKLRIKSFDFANNTQIQINKTTLSKRDPAYIICEIGNNHNGCVERGKRLVAAAADSGANAVKFQLRYMNEVYDNSEISVDHDLAVQYTLDLLIKYNLDCDALFGLFDYAKSLGLDVICTPWDEKSADQLFSYKVDAIKIASADFTNYPLLQHVAQKNMPMICSTGMATNEEIDETISYLNQLNATYALLHCNSTYPTPFHHINLSFIKSLRERSQRIVGYSGHERGYEVPIAAIAIGAKIIEKHLTEDKSLDGVDHQVSLLPNEFKKMVLAIRNVELAFIGEANRYLTQGEMINRQNLAKSITASTSIKKNDIITRDKLAIRSPGHGLQPNHIDQLVGLRASRDISIGSVFYDTDISGSRQLRRKFNFSRPYGIPVRYHDFESLTQGSNLDFVEFHLSYNDLKLNPQNFLNKKYKIGLSVHCPELFENDHILDLASLNPSYRETSLEHVRETIKVLNEIKKYFSSDEDTNLVVNAGGWSIDGFLENHERQQRYAILERSLEDLQQDLNGINVCIQTMPPFPWHFGGQRYHNLFVDPKEIAEFAAVTKSSICLDVSHSQMACNYFGWDFVDFVQQVIPHVKYWHIVDALGNDGEGIEIGKGDVDFIALEEIIRKNSNFAPFIPEVWQGHINSGTGFWEALEFLEAQGY
jgi:sialic acid synthase SpsE/sugar phosphate isomerase/epimerase